MPDRLSFLDTLFLDLEEIDPAAHMHIGAGLVFDPLPGGGAPSLAQLRRQLAERLPLLPRYGQRLSAPQTSSLTWRAWEAAADVDLDEQVRRATLPEPTEAALLEWLADFWSHRLDRRLPLWELTLLDGLPEGRWALASKTHHCLVDGVGALDIGYALLDTHPDPQPLDVQPPQLHPAPASWLSPRTAVRAATGIARHPRRTAQTAAAMTDQLLREEVVPAPACSINRPLSGARRFAVVRFDLGEIKAIKHERGGTVNDVVLALCTGGLRRMLLAREETPGHDLRAQIPINVRDDAAEHDMGNKLATLIIDLPVGVPDPAVRYQLVAERSERLKRSSQPRASAGLAALSDALPPAVGAQLGRLLFNHARMFNLTITNVPGPQQSFYAFGARMREALPLVPLFNAHHVGIAVLSYDGRLVFGLNADRPGVPDLDELARGIEESFAELRVHAVA